MNRNNDVRQIDQLTGLRAFLALLVVAHHLFYPFDNVIFIDFGTRFALFDKGYIGVDGFFILSGFILAYNYANGRPLNYRSFIAARFARIYPVHLVTLVGAIGIIFMKQFLLHKHIIGTAQNTYLGLAENLVLVNAWTFKFITGWNDVAWSVSAEWFAYVFFPIFVALAPARNRLLSGLLLLLPAAALVVLDSRAMYGGISRLVPEFYAGVLLFRLRRASGFATLPRVLGLVSVGIIALGIVTNRDTLTIVGLGMLIFALSSDADFVAPLFALAPIVYLGEVSYSLYMVQRFPMEVLSLARKTSATLAATPPLLQLVVFLALLLLASDLLHRFVELPGRTWLRRLLSGRRTEPGTAAHGSEAKPPLGNASQLGSSARSGA